MLKWCNKSNIDLIIWSLSYTSLRWPLQLTPSFPVFPHRHISLKSEANSEQRCPSGASSPINNNTYITIINLIVSKRHAFAVMLCKVVIYDFFAFFYISSLVIFCIWYLTSPTPPHNKVLQRQEEEKNDKKTNITYSYGHFLPKKKHK